MKNYMFIFITLYSLSITHTKAEEKWFGYTNTNSNLCLAIEKNYVWAGSIGGVVKWDVNLNSYTKYTTMDGLAHNCVRTIIIDNNGNKWFGTYRGVSKFDGLKWTTYDTSNGLSNWIYSGTIDKKGNLWFGTGDKGISKFDGSNWTTYTKDDGLLSNSINGICTDKAGNIFCATGNSISKYDGLRWTSYTHNFTINQTMESIAVDDNNHIWISTSNSIIESDLIINWIKYGVDDGLPQNIIRGIKIDKNGYKWALTDSGAYKFNGSKWIKFNIDNKPNIGVSDIATDENGNMYFATRNGIYKNDGSAWISRSDSNCVAWGSIQTITEDKDGNLWFGSYNSGISKFDGLNWITYNKENGIISNNSIMNIIMDNEDNLWAATGYGVTYKFDKTNWIKFDTSNGLIISGGRSIAIDLNGNIWFSTIKGLMKFDGSKWVSFIIPDELNNFHIGVIAIDQKNNIWAATSSGLGKFDGSKWTKYISPNGEANNQINDIFIDKDGTKWIATNFGVNKFDDRNWITYIEPHGLASNYVFSVLIDNNGDKWFGTYRGVSKFDGLKWTTYTAKNGLIDNYVNTIFIDHKGNLWFGTQYGVSMLKRTFPSEINDNKEKEIVREYSLFQNYPNPFNPSTIIKISIPYTSRVSLSIYNVIGQRIKILYNGQLQSGIHQFIWDGKTDKGVKASSGLYFYQLEYNNIVQTKKMILLY